MKKASFIITTVFILFNSAFGQSDIPNYLAGDNWDNVSQWKLHKHENSLIGLLPYAGIYGNGLQVNYNISPGRSDVGWVIMRRDSITGYNTNHPIVLLIKAAANDDIELKFIDQDGSVFGKRYSIRKRYLNWTSIVIYQHETTYWWGGDTKFDNLASFEVAFSGDSTGSVWIDEIGIGKEGLLSGLFLDPYREASGFGFRQRRSESVTPEDPAILEYLKIMQDSSSTDRWLLPNLEKARLISTFNNSLISMAFILKRERERAERILNFYAKATDPNNQDIRRQNFFYKGEARGFYQQVLLPDYRANDTEPRWIGDMAWLLIAYKFYEKTYGPKDEYTHVLKLIKDLLLSFYKPAGNSGYIQHGWRNGDKYLHGENGHPEGNIDCYAALKLCGEHFYADKIKAWLDSLLVGNDLPLDLYTWRVLAFGSANKDLLNIPEYDFRYRKIRKVNGIDVMGFFDSPNIDINNIWLEGIGHMACAYIAYGERQRGYFYANQFDALRLDYLLFGKRIKALSYTVNQSGGYHWVDTTKGYVSPAAWYIFAKKGFNPLGLTVKVDEKQLSRTLPHDFELYPNQPNPFKKVTTIQFALGRSAHVDLKIYNLLGQVILTLMNERKSAGHYSAVWNGRDETGRVMPSGIYLCRIKIGSLTKSFKMTLIR
jgi:hypothetical protein